MTDPAPRIEDIVDLLARLASGELSARGERSARDDDIDAVIEGINMLAEELEASYAELEQRVHDRTRELEVINQDVLGLAEVGNLLQACETVDEAYAVTTHALSTLFAGLGGAVYVYRASRNILELRAAWGDTSPAESLDPRNCWALRRGHTHFVEAGSKGPRCPHTGGAVSDSLCVPMSAQGDTTGMLHLSGRETPGNGMARLAASKRQLAVPVAEQLALALANIDLREKLRRQAVRDPLTGLHNRRFIDEWIEAEVARTDRTGRALGVIMIDIDHFKQINDLHGHVAGDLILEAAGQIFKQSMRSGDMPCRYGGEEFLILLPEIEANTLYERAEALRGAISDLRVQHGNSTLPSITLSAGIALYPEHGATATEVIQAADTALYAAKHAGRNRTNVATYPIPKPTVRSLSAST
jgi:diguanylate cyclase (GGDEF)-like protein